MNQQYSQLNQNNQAFGAPPPPPQQFGSTPTLSNNLQQHSDLPPNLSSANIYNSAANLQQQRRQSLNSRNSIQNGNGNVPATSFGSTPAHVNNFQQPRIHLPSHLSSATSNGSASASNLQQQQHQQLSVGNLSMQNSSGKGLSSLQQLQPPKKGGLKLSLSQPPNAPNISQSTNNFRNNNSKTVHQPNTMLLDGNNHNNNSNLKNNYQHHQYLSQPSLTTNTGNLSHQASKLSSIVNSSASVTDHNPPLSSQNQQQQQQEHVVYGKEHIHHRPKTSDSGWNDPPTTLLSELSQQNSISTASLNSKTRRNRGLRVEHPALSQNSLNSFQQNVTNSSNNNMNQMMDTSNYNQQYNTPTMNYNSQQQQPTYSQSYNQQQQGMNQSSYVSSNLNPNMSLQASIPQPANPYNNQNNISSMGSNNHTFNQPTPQSNGNTNLMTTQPIQQQPMMPNNTYNQSQYSPGAQQSNNSHYSNYSNQSNNHNNNNDSWYGKAKSWIGLD